MTLEVRPMSIAKLQGLQNKYSTVDEWFKQEEMEDNYVLIRTPEHLTMVPKENVGQFLKIDTNKSVRELVRMTDLRNNDVEERINAIT